jgi:anti-sigma factor RsiW
MTAMERDRFRMLMMKALDGELAGSEHSEFENFLREKECQQEWQSFRKVKEATMKLKLTEPAPEVWDDYWKGAYNRSERGIAWMLVTIGALILFSFGAIELVSKLWEDSQAPMVVKIGIFIFAGGFFLLFFSVIRERWFTSRHDKYKEVQR